MPELGEVSYYMKQWSKHSGCSVSKVEGNPKSRVFRNSSLPKVKKLLIGKKLRSAQRRAKWACFLFESDTWLSVHLGMTGSLHSNTQTNSISKHEHLSLWIKPNLRLSFVDPRMFGEIRLDIGAESPAWWNDYPLEVTSKSFNSKYFESFFGTRSNPNLKGFLLDQKNFPGVGNWMADEILWRSQLNPHRKISELSTKERTRLFKELVFISLHAEKKISQKLDSIPSQWLFHRRWDAKLPLCPKAKSPLIRETISGRSTIWSPDWQK